MLSFDLPQEALYMLLDFLCLHVGAIAALNGKQTNGYFFRQNEVFRPLTQELVDLLQFQLPFAVDWVVGIPKVLLVEALVQVHP